eukprot:gnl/Chilomastix_caulleri/4932.p1 GENE.gnl/Chilomastix_caulleri/4932~~gnl/Chilomastix_caulleri/4932.p1  ORF type:complete len:97 (+),score=8.97 gnl/Chilomastix_caulleri/4932:159-449(+)
MLGCFQHVIDHLCFLRFVFMKSSKPTSKSAKSSSSILAASFVPLFPSVSPASLKPKIPSGSSLSFDAFVFCLFLHYLYFLFAFALILSSNFFFHLL